jgi:hypothetical protein
MGQFQYQNFFKWWYLQVQLPVGIALGAIDLAMEWAACASLSPGQSMVIQTPATRMASFTLSPILASVGAVYEMQVTRYGNYSYGCTWSFVLVYFGAMA